MEYKQANKKYSKFCPNSRACVLFIMYMDWNKQGVDSTVI